MMAERQRLLAQSRLNKDVTHLQYDSMSSQTHTYSKFYCSTLAINPQGA